MWKIVAAVAILLVLLGGWPWWRVLFVKGMMAAGVNWNELGDADRLNFVTTVGLGVIGVWLGLLGISLTRQANDLTQRANIIAEKQDTYLEEERQKRATFVVTSPETKGVSGRGLGMFEFSLWITNTGRRPSKGYFYLGVPKRVLSQAQLIPQEGVKAIPVLHNYDIKINEFDSPQYTMFYDDYELHKSRQRTKSAL